MKRHLLRDLTILGGLALTLAGCPSNATDAGADGTTPGADTTPGDTGGDTGGGTPDTGAADTGGTDASGGKDVAPGDPRWVQPEGTAAISFWVDDSANQTYADAEMQWTGSFVWSEDDNTIVYATSWLPTDGPYPFLYDDGPIASGGHEMAGATAGDHIFSTEVWLKAEEDTAIEYGALNEFGNWIWIGPNGLIEIPTGSTDRFDLDGMVLPPFGPVNMRLTLDTAALNEEFAGVAPKSVFVKGSMNSWTAIQILDDGAGGDEAAGDGVYTYIHLDKIGPHDGGLRLAQAVQFVFVIGYSEGGPDEGVEYKVGGDAAPEGVGVWTDWETAGTWTVEELLLKLDSKGKTLNTAIVVGDDENLPTACTSDADCPGQKCDLGTGDCVPKDPTGCTSDADCPGQKCDLGTGDCVPLVPLSKPVVQIVDPDSGPTTGGTAVTITGTELEDGVEVWFGGAKATGVSAQGGTTVQCTTPAGAAGKADVKVQNPDGGTYTVSNGFEYLDASLAPKITSVQPATGSVKGGTAVTISGSGFGTGAIVTFGGKQATDVAVQATSITLKTPANPVGPVDVKVTNTNSQADTKAGAFTYVPDSPDWAGLIAPLAVTVFEGQPTALLRAEIYEDGITNAPGQGSSVQAELGWGPQGSDPFAGGSGWSWTSAEYQGDLGNNDVWGASLTVATPGSYDWAVRFTVNAGETWIVADGDGAASEAEYASASAGKLTVKAVPTTPTVLGMSPKVATVLGGTTITLSGVKLSGVTSVLVDGQGVTPDSVTDTTVTFKAPAHVQGVVDVEAALPGSTIDVPDSLSYGLVASPVVDGTLGAEWPDAFKLAENTVESDWSAANVLTGLWAAFDSNNLYLGVAGVVEPANAIVVYVDVDQGAGTGAAAMSMLTDEDGALDACFSGGLNVTAPGFGAEYGVGAIGEQSIKADGLSDWAGWRALTPSDNFGWVPGDVVAGAGGMEMSIPLQTLFPTGVPAAGAKVAVVVRITYYGESYSNQSLPMGVAGDGSTQQTAVAVFTVYGG